MSSLLGIHDIEGADHTPQGTWLVDTVALSESPQLKDYRRVASGLNVIVRANWGYGSTGTLPTVDRYDEYVDALATYVRGCAGCHRWIIGNEPNLSREWPDGQPILPHHYAACYMAARAAVQALDGHERDEVLVAGSGPWNDELKYPGNERGDWVQYTLDCLRPLGPDCDGVALHAYCHGYSPSLASSQARMNDPFQDRYYNFLTFTDYLRAFPAILAAGNYYITEANGNGPWQATGLIPAMLDEVDKWNQQQGGPFMVRCMVCYRYPHYDDFYMEGRGDVMAEYVASAPLFDSPSGVPPQPPTPEEPDNGERDQRNISADFIASGGRVEFANAQPGQGYWRAVLVDKLNEQESDEAGPDHHILGGIFKDDAIAGDISFWVTWPSGSTTIQSKAQAYNGYNYDFPMSKSLNEYSINVADGNASDKVTGVGMGANGNPGLHTSTWIDWSWTIAGEEPVPPQPPSKQKLIWPCNAPITQWFGENAAYYQQAFNQPAHNGIDFGCPVGTPLVAVADGVVKWVDNDPEGYGLYIRVYHPAVGLHTVIAHLSEQDVIVGEQVKQAQTLGLSGNSGNSSGPHCHFETRSGSEDAYYDLHDGYGKGRGNPMVVYAQVNGEDPNETIGK